jgi:hypothetical protein
MSALNGLSNGIQAALLLARGRPEGVGLLAATDGEAPQATATRSFWAAALCLPAFMCLQLIDWAQPPGAPSHAGHELALDLLGYVIDWAGFALLSRWLAGTMDRGANWPTFVAAWNWCNVVQYLLLVLASLPPLLGAPQIVGETAWLVATGWALWLEWYATRLTLDITRLQAAGLVLIDLAMGFAGFAIIQSIQG